MSDLGEDVARQLDEELLEEAELNGEEGQEFRVLPPELYEAVFDFEKRLREITKSSDSDVEVEKVYVTQERIDVEFLLPGGDKPFTFSLERP